MATMRAYRDTLLLGWRVLFARYATRRSVVTEDVVFDGLRLRSFASASSRFPVVVLHGLTRQGFDDDRLTSFASALAATGFVAYTPDLEGLRNLDLDESDIERITASIRIAHERHDEAVGVMGFSVGATYGLIAASKPDTRALVDYVLAVGAYYSLKVVFANVYTREAREWYPVLAMDWPRSDRLGLTPDDEAMYCHIMDHCCQHEKHLSQAERALIADIMSSPAQTEIREWWQDRLSGKTALQLEGNSYLGDIDAEVLLLCSRDDPLIPPSETVRIAEELERVQLCVENSAGHLNYQGRQLPGMFRLLSRIMTIRQERADAGS